MSNSLIEIFPWNENFNIDIDIIDEQHKGLARLINQLALVLVEGNELEISEIHKELGEYAEMHFRDEEIIWQAYLEGDSLYKDHKLTHSSFMDKVLELTANQEGRPYNDIVEEIVKFLIGWLAFHILDTDKRMSLVIKNLKKGKSLAEAKKLCNEEMSDSKQVLINTILGMYENLSTQALNLMRERHLRIQAEEELKNANDSLEAKVLERTTELKLTQEVTMVAMASLAELRDPETGKHIRRTQHYVKLLAEELSSQLKYSNILTPQFIDTLFLSSALHDIGKIGIPDEILRKSGKLTDSEFEIMKRHSELGRDALRMAQSVIGQGESFLSLAEEIAYSHHEKWDGSGYPNGFTGENIYLSARIMAVADVYDALTSRRVYKDKFSHNKAVEIIIEGKGSHFDPDIVEAFISISDEFYKTSQNYVD
ncbi:MAG: putative two-component system response regulator [Alteromonadaceae bacterium]|jgi:putative two-component system response regulator